MHTEACTQPSGYVEDNTDCDDTNPNVNPGATEVCNGMDDDCDSDIDEDFTDEDCQYVCEGNSYIWTNNGGNLNCCGNDANEDSPYQETETNCDDGHDNDCDGLIDALDPDCFVCTPGEKRACPKQDGVCAGSEETCTAEGTWSGCDYSTIQYYEETEVSCDDKDNDCDGYADEGLTTTYYQDADSDTYGNAAVSQEACTKPSGYVTDNTDCDDTNININPGATEVCNGVDDDCDGLTDEDLTAPLCEEQKGVCFGSIKTCGGVSGWLACDASNYGSNYEEPEATCDGLDNDCDGSTDENGAILCDDGVSCTVDSCNEGTDSCDNIANNALCNDGIECTQNICDETLDCTYPNEPSGTQCGQARDCEDSACSGVFAELYPADGHDTCDGAGLCVDYSCAMTDSYCSDSDPNDGINTLQCGAECDQDTDCDDSDPRTIDTCSGACICEYEPAGECLTDADCDDSLWCNGQETCDITGYCKPGTALDCSDSNECTDDICIEDGNSQGHCENPNLAQGTLCGDARDCQDSACSGVFAELYPADGHDTCDGTGTCDIYLCEMTDSYCSDNDPNDGINTLQCGAECDQDSDCTCEADTCIDSDGDGLLDDYVDYPDANCQNDCTCTGCDPTTYENDERCKKVMKIPVDGGVSIFSLPLMPVADVTFNDIQSGCAFTGGITKGIAYYNPTAGSYTYIDANTVLYPGQGYFVTIENECEFTMTGDKFTIDHVGYLGTNSIKPGWNLIGAPSEKINDFDDVEGICDVVSGPWGFDAAQYQYERTQTLMPGKGYFIKTTNNCNLG